MSSSYTGDQPGQPCSSFHGSDQHGQDSRQQAQYAEFDPNTAPQVCIGNDPEVVFPPIEPDVAHRRPGDVTSQVAVDEKTQGPKGFWARLGKRKMMWLAGLVIAICIILAISISVPLVADKAGRSNKGGSEASASAPASPTKTNSPIVSTCCPHLRCLLTKMSGQQYPGLQAGQVNLQR